MESPCLQRLVGFFVKANCILVQGKNSSSVACSSGLFLDISKKKSRQKKLKAKKTKAKNQKLNISPTRTNFFSKKVHNVIDFALKLVQTGVFYLTKLKLWELTKILQLF